MKLFIIIGENKNEFIHFGNVSISWKCDGPGMSGVTSAMLSFDVPYVDYPVYSSDIPGGAEIIIGYENPDGSMGRTRTFYVSSKSRDGISITVKCYDRAMFTECDFPCTDEDFVDLNGNEKKMPVSQCLERIAEVCGFYACMMPSEIIGSADFSFPKSSLMGRSCHDVLNEISKALCGYFVCQSGTPETLQFIALGFDNSGTSASVSSEYHEKLVYTSRLTVKSVYMTDGNIVYGGSRGGNDTVSVNSPAASAELYDALSSRLTGFVYSGFKCEHALLDTIPDFPPPIYFKGEEKIIIANYCDMKLSSSGIVASVGNNTVDEGAWKYIPKTQRELDQRYKEGDAWNNVELTKKGGIKYVYENKNTGKKEKYGFETKSGGYTSHEGVISSSKEANTVTVDKSSGTVTVNYSDGHIYRYHANVSETSGGYEITNEGDEWT